MTTHLNRTQRLNTTLRLHGWLSPSFPIGAYTYSHGLEQIIEVGLLKTTGDLIDRITSILNYGAGWIDGLFCKLAMETHDPISLLYHAWSLRGAGELGFESTQQGEAFIQTVQKVWPMKQLGNLKAAAQINGIEISYPVAFGVAARAINAPKDQAISLFLMAFVHNLVSAAVRAVPLGQTDGQRAIAALEPEVIGITSTILAADETQIGATSIAHDIASMNHEIQRTRIFRS